MATTAATTSGPAPDLGRCEQEPIRIPGSIQPHGVLLAVNPVDLRVEQASGNAAGRLGAPARDLVGKPLARALGEEGEALVRAALNSVAEGEPPRFLRTVRPPAAESTPYHLLVHRTGQALIVELERAHDRDAGAFDALYPLVQSLVGKLAAATSVSAACAIAAAEVRRMTGFDRVLVYRFDESWNGTVVAEDGNDRLPSYLDLRFPATDIPAQARDLYRLNPIRLIPDAGYQPVPLEPGLHPSGGGEPLDLSFAVLRSVSPVHLEYMRNMGTAASMSVSILEGEKLWGLISCHNRDPHEVPFHVRTACTFVGQVLAQQIAAVTRGAEYAGRIELKTIQGRLLARMAASPRFVDGLCADVEDLLGLTHAAGAAVVSAGTECATIGQTPSPAEIRQIVDWLSARGENEVFATDQLSALFPPAARHADVASGLLAVSFSKLHARYVLWFRPEVVRTVTWAGDPTKAADAHTGRIHPRHSFEAWKETVRERATPWTEQEVEAATELRNNVVGIVLRRAEEMAELTSELERSNKELEAFSYSVSHDLRAPFRHIVGYAELLREDERLALGETGKRYVDTIIESAQYAGTLVDNLLMFSQMGRASLSYTELDMGLLVNETFRDLGRDMIGRDVKLEVKPLPRVRGDLMMLRLVVQNLLSNAVKYTRSQPHAIVEVGCETGAREHVFYVRDNGVGFDMKYVDKLFGVFQRLHRMEEFEGTGIGLANVRRIVGRHGGRTWAEGVVGEGATFYFTLPVDGAS